jgi:hypothetical protein
MLVLTRTDRFHNAEKSKVNIYHGGELIGCVVVESATHGLCRLGFGFQPEYGIKRSEIDDNEANWKAA